MQVRPATYSAVVFGGTIVPVTIILGLIIYALSRLDGMAGSPGQALTTALSFLLIATAAHFGLLAMIAPARARIFVRRRWAFPLSCGVLFSAFVVSGLVENSTDVAGRMIGQQHGLAIEVAAVLGWSGLATGLMAGLDRVLPRPLRTEKQIA